MMKMLLMFFTILSGVFGTSFAQAAEPNEKFIVVGVSGFRTGRAPEKAMDILSDDYCTTCDPNGAWSNLPRSGSKIYQRAFLSHYSSSKEVDAVIKLFQNRKKVCNPDLGMIIMANSWGASIANQLAKRFQVICKKPVEFFALIDGIQKPVTLPYSRALAAKSCLNIYQKLDVVHGGRIAKCKNINLMEGMQNPGGIGAAHIYTEWNGTEYAAQIIEALLD